jgi:hypothetical protein
MENSGPGEGVDDETFQPTEIRASEAFSIQFGNHVKSLYHFRLEEVNKILSVNNDPEQQFGLRVTTASELYSSNLSGIIVLVDKSQLEQYARGLSANKGIFFLLDFFCGTWPRPMTCLCV